MGLDSKGDFAGDYCDSGGVIHGELGKNFKWKSDVTTPFDSAYTGERAVNKSGTIVGYVILANMAELSAWRWMYATAIVPAILVVLGRRKICDSVAWLEGPWRNRFLHEECVNATNETANAFDPGILPVQIAIGRSSKQGVHAHCVGTVARHHLVGRDSVAQAL